LSDRINVLWHLPKLESFGRLFQRFPNMLHWEVSYHKLENPELDTTRLSDPNNYIIYSNGNRPCFRYVNAYIGVGQLYSTLWLYSNFLPKGYSGGSKKRKTKELFK